MKNPIIERAAKHRAAKYKSYTSASVANPSRYQEFLFNPKQNFLSFTLASRDEPNPPQPSAGEHYRETLQSSSFRESCTTAPKLGDHSPVVSKLRFPHSKTSPNQRKIDILLEGFQAQKPPNITISITVPSESEVGEQPYDKAGLQGARDRIANALQNLGDSSDIILEKVVSVVIATSIENYIQRLAEAAGGTTWGGQAGKHDAVD